ncbi:MAG: winged helix-turn-helix transcriptional regulator [Acidobacteria bacterium]|nr:winged helix-turn-helix transcriptional regulator [Acidobacteriota bacterium]
MKSREEDVLESVCACAALRAAARSATQLYDLVLQPAGLKITQFIALKSIGQAGEIAQWKYARQHAIAVETLSRRLAALRKRGLVCVRRGGKHGERIYALTEQGKKMLNDTVPYWERAQQRLRRTLGDGEFPLLLELCRKTIDAAHKAEQLRTANSRAPSNPTSHSLSTSSSKGGN